MVSVARASRPRWERCRRDASRQGRAFGRGKRLGCVVCVDGVSCGCATMLVSSGAVERQCPLTGMLFLVGPCGAEWGQMKGKSGMNNSIAAGVSDVFITRLTSTSRKLSPPPPLLSLCMIQCTLEEGRTRGSLEGVGPYTSSGGRRPGQSPSDALEDGDSRGISVYM